MIKKILLSVLIAVMAISLSGCIKFGSKTTKTSELGGVFLTTDKMESWQSISKLMTPGAQNGTIADTDIYFLRMDPTDTKTIWAGTRYSGLFYTNNAGTGWNKTEGLPQGYVRDAVIDKNYPCTVYVALESKIYKSVTCGREWKEVWFADSVEKKVTALAIDPRDPRIIYAGVSEGTVLRSDDFGGSWKVINNFKKRIYKIIVDSNDPQIVYVGVSGRGLFKTANRGGDWQDLNPQMKGFKKAYIYHAFDVSASTKNLIVYASQFGILRSLDGGTTWSEVPILTREGDERIYDLAIDPQNASNIFYSTDRALYKTSDAGENWTVKTMPTTRFASSLLVHPKDANVIYMGVKKLLD